MPRQRDHAAEYARRQARAREQGFRGYWQQRVLRRETPTARGREQAEASPGAKADPAAYRAGVRALKAKDFAEANRLARQLGVRGRGGRPAWWFIFRY